jgi:acyl carrier protein
MPLTEMITQAVRRNAIRKSVAMNAHSDLLQLGILDSLGIVALVADLEEELACRVAPEEIVPENFSTIEGMVRLFRQLAGANYEE